MKGKRRLKLAKTKGDVKGSGIKPAPQKGRGKARTGNKRAPHRKGGGAAHGPVPQDLTEKINIKTRLKALQIMLSAKLYEERIVLIESEKIDYAKTKFMHEVMKPYINDKLTFLTPFETDRNFIQATQNLKNIQLKNPY